MLVCTDDYNPLPLQAPLKTPVESLENFIGLQKLALKITLKKQVKSTCTVHDQRFIQVF